MMTVAEDAIQKRKFPEVCRLYSQRHREMGIPFADNRWISYYADKIDEECAALQAKLEARQEARFWEEWGDVDNVTYHCRRVQKPTPWAADDDEDEKEGGDGDAGGDNDDDDDDGGDDDDEWYVDITQD